MELHTADAIRIMTYRHHHAFKRGINGQPRRDIASHQRVVARDRERIRQPGKHCLAVMFNTGGFAVQDLTRLANVAAVGFNNRLMSQTDADDRQLAAHTGQQLRHTARFARCAWPRGEHQHRVLHGCQTVNQGLRRYVVAVDNDVVTIRTQLICQVIGKRVDIIEQQNVSHQKISCAWCAVAMARRTARALLRVSSASDCGTESRTIPAPAWTVAIPSST